MFQRACFKYVFVLLTIFLSSLTSCFTGIESTPKISSRDIKRQKVSDSPEKLFLDDVSGQKPSTWTRGKSFFVTDDRLSLVFDPSTEYRTDSLAGKLIYLYDIQEAALVTGDKQVVLKFDTDDGRRLSYRTGVSPDKFASRESFAIPFAIETSVIDTVGARLRGQTYYVLPARRIASSGSDTIGVRYVPVTIDDVLPGNANFPLRVSFIDNTGCHQSLMMTVGHDPTSTRNFDKLFAFDNPRKRFPLISDRVWSLIMQSRVELGMTPDECRLALGAPNDYLRTPSSAGMVERWSYDDGVFLVFVDGFLTRFRR